MKKGRFGKKVWAGLLILVLLSTVLPLSVMADENTLSPNAAGVYEISTAQELQAISTMAASGETFSNKTIQLTADIDMDLISNWVPIANFHGIFDGQGKTISNLTVNVPDNAGLFASVSNAEAIKPVFKDVTLFNFNVTATNSYAGALIGNAFTTDTISNCTVDNSTITAKNFVGGITGTGYVKIDNCTVKNSSVKSSVNGRNLSTGDNIGGIIGHSGEGLNVTQITNCKTINTNVSGVRKVAGILGTVSYGTVIDNCSVKGGTLTGTFGAPLTFLKYSVSLGGIAGQLVGGESQTITIKNCKVDPDVVYVPSGASYVDWLVGDPSLRIDTSTFINESNQNIAVTE